MNSKSKNGTSNLYDILFLGIKQHASMYIGDNSFFSLSKFIYGYIFALSIHELDEGIPSFDKFDEWVAHKFNREETTLGWYSIILNECEMNDKVAFDYFFRLLEDFIIENGGIVPIT